MDDWKQNVYPVIQKRDKKLSAEIYFEDESGIRSDFHSGRTWALKGETPVIEITGARFSLNVIGAVSPRGHLRFMVIQGGVASYQIFDFIHKIMHNVEKPIFLIWDDYPTHRSKIVKECIASYGDCLEVYTIPSYSPEINPS